MYLKPFNFVYETCISSLHGTTHNSCFTEQEKENSSPVLRKMDSIITGKKLMWD